MIVYAAKHLLPVASPPIQSGAVVVHEGRIATVGRRKDVVRAHPGVEVRDLGEAAIVPGLINAHTHLELSHLHDPQAQPTSFMAWVRDLVARRGQASEEAIESAATAAVETMISRGTVAGGEGGNGTVAGRVLARSTLAGILFHELYGFRAS